MTHNVNLTELKKAINLAENELEKLKDGDRRHLKQRRISRALKRAYALLNKSKYTQDEVDKMTRIVIRSLQDMPVLWFYFFGTALAGAVLFASYETYSFFSVNWDKIFPIKWPLPYEPVKPDEPDKPSKPDKPDKPDKPITDSGIIYVSYEESNIVNLENLFSVDDADGLKNPAQKFSLRNTGIGIFGKINYEIPYNVNINELKISGKEKIDKKYIRYQLTHYDSSTNEKISESIGKFSDLERNPNGSYKMYTGVQKKNAKTNFEVVVWIGPDAPNSEQGKAFAFSFDVAATIKQK